METIPTMSLIDVNITVYLVRSQDGKWFRSKGQKGYGDSWVDDPKYAKVFTKLAPARGCVTFWANKYPQYGIPNLIELHSPTGVILNEVDRVFKSINSIKQRKMEEELNDKKSRVEEAQIEMDKAIAKWNALKK